MTIVGKYKIDEDVYHRDVKPQMITKFVAEFKKQKKDFKKLCGKNPDFVVDKSGIVNPEPVGKGFDHCPKVFVHIHLRYRTKIDTSIFFLPENIPFGFGRVVTWVYC